MQHWHQPKHIIYDTTESYILLLNSPYSIFEHLLPQCTAHYQGYRSKTHTHAVWTHQHHEDAFYVEMVWSYYCSSAVRRVPVQLSRFWLGFTADVCRVSSHSAADGVSAGRLSHYTTTEEKLLVLGSYTVVTKRVARLFIGRCTYKLYFV